MRMYSKRQDGRLTCIRLLNEVRSGFVWRSGSRTVLHIVIVLALTMSGCEAVIDAEFPEYTPELAVYSFVSPGSPIYVSVFRTQDIRSSSSELFETVAGANVEIWQGSALRATAILSDSPFNGEADSYYRADWVDSIVTDEPITLRVSVAGLPSVVSTVAMPESVPFTFLSATVVDEQDEFGGGNSRLVTARFRIQDQIGSNSFYLIVRNPEAGPTDSFIDNSFSISDAPFRETEVGDSEDYVVRYYFTDTTFTDGPVSFSVKYRDNDAGGDLFELYSVSRSYYEYERTRRVQSDSDDNPFAEPAPIYSNIEGGQGVWATTSVPAVARVSSSVSGQ